MEEIYFCLYLTSNEHECVEQEIREFCQSNEGYELVYYRQLKDGHIPMYREVKIRFPENNKKPWFYFMNKEYSPWEFRIDNPHILRKRKEKKCTQ